MNFSDYFVLIVDDDNSNLVVTEYILGKYFNVLSSSSGDNALDIIFNKDISVLVVDQKMPGMSGIDLAEKCVHINPDIIKVLITAYSDLPMAIDAINRGRVNHFIKKPWIPEELVSIVRQSIIQYHDNSLFKIFQEKQIRMDRIRTLGVLSAGIAHDMRQPLTYITHFLNSIHRDMNKIHSLNKNDVIGQLLKSIEKDMNDISHGINVLSTLSDNLFNHINNLPLKLELFSLKEVVNSVLLISKYTIRKHAILLVDLPESNCNIYSCKTRVSQILLNLLLNAAQSFDSFSDNNTINLSISLNSENVLIDVKDNGSGIDDTIRKYLFEPLFSTKTYIGTGLGLSICKVNVEDLGGNIVFDSQPGIGTTFTIELPIHSSV